MPVDANLDRTTCGTAQSGKPHRYLTGGSAAPTAKAAADVKAAWTGRAVVVSERV